MLKYKIILSLSKLQLNFTKFKTCKHFSYRNNNSSITKVEAPILSKKEIYSLIDQYVETDDRKFFDKVKTGEFDEKLFSQVKKNSKFIPNSFFVEYFGIACESENRNPKLFNYFESQFEIRLEYMTLDLIAKTMYWLGKIGSKNKELFFSIEEEIIKRQVELIPFELCKKMLFGLHATGFGTNRIFMLLSKSLKACQFEIDPLVLMTHLKYFSHTENTANGNYGLNNAIEKILTLSLPTYKFDQLLKICKSTIPYNVCTQEFNHILEDCLIEKFPQILNPSQLSNLCKYTSSYYFTRQNLGDKIDAFSLKYIKGLTNSQLEIIVWSLSRSRKGSKAFFKEALSEIILRRKLFSERSIAFLLYSISNSYPWIKDSDLIKIEKEILTRISKFSIHYLIKILIAFNNLQYTKSDGYKEILTSVEKLNENIKQKDLVKFMFFMSDRLSINHLSLAQHISASLRNKISTIFPFCKADEKCYLFFSHVMMNTFTDISYPYMLEHLPDSKDVPKPAFAVYYFSLIWMREFGIAQEMQDVIDDLRELGNIKFFFNHENLTTIYWCELCLHKEFSSSKPLDSEYLNDIAATLMEINPNTLSTRILHLYIQSLKFLLQFSVLDQKSCENKLKEIHPDVQAEFEFDFIFNANNSEIKNEIEEIIYKFEVDIKANNITVNIDKTDEFLFSHDIYIEYENEDVEIQIPPSCLKIVNKNFFDYKGEINLAFVQDIEFIMKYEESNIKLLKEEDWIILSIEQKSELIKEIIFGGLVNENN